MFDILSSLVFCQNNHHNMMVKGMMVNRYDGKMTVWQNEHHHSDVIMPKLNVIFLIKAY